MGNEKIGNPSQVFRQYVMRFPESHIARQYLEDGTDYIELAGSFTRSLYEGEVWKALQRADRSNQQRLALILKYGWTYPIEIKEHAKEEHPIDGDGQKQMTWEEARQRIAGDSSG